MYECCSVFRVIRPASVGFSDTAYRIRRLRDHRGRPIGISERLSLSHRICPVP